MDRIVRPKQRPLEVPAHLALPTDHDITAAIRGLEVIEPESVNVIGFRVLLKIADKDKISKGGIILPGSQIEKDLFASIKATVVKVGTRAFEDEQLKDRPKVGDKVHIAKYAGLPLRDAEFNMYRYANDEDIISVEK